MSRPFFQILLLLVSTSLAFADLHLASPFSSHMVLQRDRDIPIWGTQSPGEKVSVRFAGQEAHTTADPSGNWSVTFSPLAAGGSHTLIVTSGQENIACVNMTMGDIWVCSGQSNMEWYVSKSAHPKKETAAAQYPDIRLLNIDHRTSDQATTTFDARWNPCTPSTIPKFSAVGYYFGRELHKNLGIPIGLISSNWGGTLVEAWTPLSTVEADPEFKPLVERRQKFLAKQAKRAALENPPPMTPKEKKAHRPQDIASMLYDGMITPLTKLPIKGVIWYQGESNVKRAEQYETLFPAMIQGWRNAWGQGNFPFYFVQLANYKKRNTKPVDDTWAELRDAQRQALRLPNTGMAVAIDIGDAKNGHPKNKQDVGKRLALWALANDYEFEPEASRFTRLPFIGRLFRNPIIFSGPLYRKYHINGNQVVIHFDHTGEGLSTSNDTPLSGFAIAGADRKFIWANATIDGNQVIVSHPDISAPVAVRYGWSINPEVNLINSAQLPASPFRTDDWPGITDGKK